MSGALAAPAAFAGCVTRAQELHSQLDERRRDYTEHVLHPQHLLAKRLQAFAAAAATAEEEGCDPDGLLSSLGEKSLDGDTGRSAITDWDAWARSSVPIQPLPPLLQLSLRVHWFVSSAEAILAALAQGHEATAVQRWFELRAASATMKSISMSFPVTSAACSSLEDIRLRIIAVCTERLHSPALPPTLSPGKASVLLTAIYTLGGHMATNSSEDASNCTSLTALIELFYRARVDAVRRCITGAFHGCGESTLVHNNIAFAKDPGSPTTGLPGNGAPKHIALSVLKGLRDLCKVLESSRPHQLLETLCTIYCKGQGQAAANAGGATSNSASADAYKLENAAADGWKQVASVVDSAVRCLLRLDQPSTGTDALGSSDIHVNFERRTTLATSSLTDGGLLCTLLSNLEPEEPCALAFSAHLEDALRVFLDNGAVSQPAIRMLLESVEQALTGPLLQDSGSMFGSLSADDSVGPTSVRDRQLENERFFSELGLRLTDGCTWLANAYAVEGATIASCEWKQIPRPIARVIHTAAASAKVAFLLRNKLRGLTRSSGARGDDGKITEIQAELAVEECVRWALPLLRSLEDFVARACPSQAGAPPGQEAELPDHKCGVPVKAPAQPLLLSLVIIARLSNGFATQLPRWPLILCGAPCCSAAKLSAVVDGFSTVENLALSKWARLNPARLPPPLETGEVSSVGWLAVQLADDAPDNSMTSPHLTLPAEASKEIVQWLWNRQRAIRTLGISSMLPMLLAAEAAESSECLRQVVRRTLRAIEAGDRNEASDGARSSPWHHTTLGESDWQQRRAFQLYFDLIFCRAALQHRPQLMVGQLPISSRGVAMEDRARRADGNDAAIKPSDLDKAIRAALDDAEAEVSGWLQRHDPITWAVAQKPIRAAVARALTRVLHIVSLEPLGPQATANAASMSARTILRQSTQCGRFPYLPIQTPPLHSPNIISGAGGAAGQQATGATHNGPRVDALRGTVDTMLGPSTIVGRMREETRSALVGMGQLRGMLSGGAVLSERFTGVGGAHVGSLFSGMGDAARAAQMALGVKTPRR